MQDKTFNPSGFQGRLRACPFLGSWRALFRGRFMLGLDETATVFLRIDDSRFNAVRISVNRWFFTARPV